MTSRKGERDPRLKHVLDNSISTEDEERNAILTVCDPAEGYDRVPPTKEEAKEILTALGLLNDPEHTEMNYLGRKAGT